MSTERPDTDQQLLGPLSHIRGPLGRPSVGIHVQFSFVEELPIQLLDRKCHFLHGAHVYKCEAAKEGEGSSEPGSEQSRRRAPSPRLGRVSSPLRGDRRGAGPTLTHKEATMTSRLGLGWAVGEPVLGVLGIGRHVLTLSPYTIWHGSGLPSHRSPQNFKALLLPGK